MKEICVRNSVVCNKCKDEIVSEHRHDFKMCSCGSVGVDGGLGCIRHIGDDYTDTSVYTASVLVAREHLKRNMTTLLKDMETSWVENVIIYEEEHRPNNPFLPFYKAELKLREDGTRDKLQ